jgi:hypothetical protein
MALQSRTSISQLRETSQISISQPRSQRNVYTTNNPQIKTNAGYGKTEHVQKDSSNTSGIIGLPPQIIHEYGDSNTNEIMRRLVMASIPVAVIIPAYPTIMEESISGLHLYSLDFGTGHSKYQEIINNAISGTGISMSVPRKLLTAYLHETSLTETWQNEYGPSAIEDAASGLGGGPGTDVTTMAGKTKQSEGWRDLRKNAKKVGWIGAGLMGTMNELQETGIDIGSWFGGIDSELLNKLRGAAKINFPNIWKNSAYNTNYTITVRLYNPHPHCDDSYMTYIVEPLIRLICLGLPYSDGGSDATYTQNVSCKVECPGLWTINAGFLASMEVIKGGDSNEVNFLQRPNIIDVRLSFGELYGVMTSSSDYNDRPTLKSYINNLLNKPSLNLNIYDGTRTVNDDVANNITVQTTITQTDDIRTRTSDTDKNAYQALYAKYDWTDVDNYTTNLNSLLDDINELNNTSTSTGIGSDQYSTYLDYASNLYTYTHSE